MMQHITGIARNQMVFKSLEDPISKDIQFVLSTLLWRIKPRKRHKKNSSSKKLPH